MYFVNTYLPNFDFILDIMKCKGIESKMNVKEKEEELVETIEESSKSGGMQFDYKLHFLRHTNKYVFIYTDDEIEFIYVGDSSPLWCCKNAMNKDHECCYTLCHSCYMSRPGSRGKRKRVDQDNDCDHDSLEVETRSDYFSPMYLRKNNTTPSRCSNCLKMLTSLKYMAAC